MSFWNAVVAIVAIAAFMNLRAMKYRAMGGDPHRFGHFGRMGRHPVQSLLDNAGPSPREVELQHEVEELRERIHVLERIATEDRTSRDLAAEIESLRK